MWAWIRGCVAIWVCPPGQAQDEALCEYGVQHLIPAEDGSKHEWLGVYRGGREEGRGGEGGGRRGGEGGGEGREEGRGGRRGN